MTRMRVRVMRVWSPMQTEWPRKPMVLLRDRMRDSLSPATQLRCETVAACVERIGTSVCLKITRSPTSHGVRCPRLP